MQHRPVPARPTADRPPSLVPLPMRLRPATPGDFDAVADLARLIDLRRSAEDLAPSLEVVRETLATGAGDEGPFSHGPLHYVLAEFPDNGRPVGLARCGPGRWTVELDLPTFIRNKLYPRIGNVHELVVVPEYRGRGIARALLERVEEDHRRAGYDALVLRHHREQTSFYTHLGYTSGSRLVLELPDRLGRASVRGQGWRWAAKPLAPQVEVTDVHGSPVLTGLLAPHAL
ncbi:GNAT family N-acetyltransferase [Kitasatospora purpeofusca]|uniref:GNAT family N-acetyltransferase n=1 Tax=Kitasatospora purpeofusca TaxID=67352 RepID=UPI0036A4D133